MRKGTAEQYSTWQLHRDYYVTVGRTQEERRADTRARLLDAAATLFAAHGVDAVSVDAVAEAAGRTSGAVYDHFGSKQGLLLALLDEWKHSLMGVIVDELEASTTLDERLRAVARAVIVEPSPDTRRLLLLERELGLRAARNDDIAQALRARMRAAQDNLRGGFARWRADGLLPEESDPDVLATAFRAVVTGLEMQQRIDGMLDTDAVVAALGAVLP